MSLGLNAEAKRVETDVLVLGAGAAGCGAAMAAKRNGEGTYARQGQAGKFRVPRWGERPFYGGPEQRP